MIRKNFRAPPVRSGYTIVGQAWQACCRMRDASLALPPQVHIDAGIGAAAQLLSAGVIDICVIEKQNQLGGVWRENTYPGCACDVPSAFYSCSFAPNAHWKRFYGQQEEIRQYLEDTASASGVLGKIVFNCDMSRAS